MLDLKKISEHAKGFCQIDEMEGADYKEFLEAEFFVVAMGIVKNEISKLKEQDE